MCVSCIDLDYGYASDAIIRYPFVWVSMLYWRTGDDNTGLLKYSYYYSIYYLVPIRSGALAQCQHKTPC